MNKKRTTLKENIYNILERPYINPFGYAIQTFLMTAVAVNVLAYVLPFFYYYTPHQLDIIENINSVTMIIFVIEYALRLLVSGENNKFNGLKGKFRWFIDPLNIIDFITILPFFICGNGRTITMARLLRPMRLLKFLRLKKFFKRFINLQAFASAKFYVQTVVLLLFSIIIILLFGAIFGSIKTSAMVFIDPPAIASITNVSQILIGIIELLIGLFFGGALISILTSTLVDITDRIKMGYYPFKDEEHIIIINNNIKLNSILKELELSLKKDRTQKDIVLLLPNVDDIEQFRNNLPKFKHITLTIITGSLLNENSYINANINKAEKIVILKEETKKAEVGDIETVQFILTSKNFKNDKLDFVIETTKDEEDDNATITKQIYQTLFYGRKNQYVLVDTVNIINKFLTRSIISYDYFKIYDQLVSFEGYEFYIISFNELFPNEESLTFQDVCFRLRDVIAVGYCEYCSEDGKDCKEQVAILNPINNPTICKDCEIIVIATNKHNIKSDGQIYNIKGKEITIPAPSKKIDKKIVGLGDSINLNKNLISQFINNNYKEIKKFKQYDKDFWINLLDSYDAIIININDKDNLKLNLYLHKILGKDFERFRRQCVNIITDPIYAELIENNTFIKSNIVLSHDLVGKYMTQLMYAPKLEKIFDEITQPYGSEPYVIKRSDKTYSFLWNYDVDTIKRELILYNEMIYLGAFIKDENNNEQFKFNMNDISHSDRIVVLSKGQ